MFIALWEDCRKARLQQGLRALTNHKVLKFSPLALLAHGMLIEVLSNIFRVVKGLLQRRVNLRAVVLYLPLVQPNDPQLALV